MTKNTIAVCRWSLLIGIALGTIVGCTMMYIAWQHNPQEEYHGPGAINWVAWLAIGVSWLVPVAAVSGTAAFVLWSAVSWITGSPACGPNRATAGDGRHGGIR